MLRVASETSGKPLKVVYFFKRTKHYLALLTLLISLLQGTLLADDPLASDAGLKDDLDYIKKNAGEMVDSKFVELGKPANRDFHSRGVCLKGTFKTFPQNMPKDVVDVAFFKLAATYAMFGRFSNGFPGRDANDHLPSVFGFGAKVIGVPGKKFDIQSMGSTKPKNSNQDWNLATGATFPIPNAAIYRDNREMGKLDFAVRHPVITEHLIKGLKHIDSFQQMSYYSQAALHFGEDHVAKFSVVPCDGVEKTILLIQAELRSKTYLTENLTTDIKTKGACFSFRAQIRPSDEKLAPNKANWAKDYPKDNPTVLWPADVISYVKLAEIKFPPQPQVANFQKYCEQELSINPGNALEEFRPIETDTLMRSRFLAAYEGSVAKRTSLNKVAQSEPAPIAADQLEKWLLE